MTTIELAANALVQQWTWRYRAKKADGNTEWANACREEEKRWRHTWNDLVNLMSITDLWTATDRAAVIWEDGEPTCFLQVEVA